MVRKAAVRKRKTTRRKALKPTKPARSARQSPGPLELREIESLRGEIERVARTSGTPRWNANPDDVRRSVVKLVLTLVDFVRQLLERQALRRDGRGTLTPAETEAIGTRADAARGDRARSGGAVRPQAGRPQSRSRPDRQADCECSFLRRRARSKSEAPGRHEQPAFCRERQVGRRHWTGGAELHHATVCRPRDRRRRCRARPARATGCPPHPPPQPDDRPNHRQLTGPLFFAAATPSAGSACSRRARPLRCDARRRAHPPQSYLRNIGTPATKTK